MVWPFQAPVPSSNGSFTQSMGKSEKDVQIAASVKPPLNLKTCKQREDDEYKELQELVVNALLKIPQHRIGHYNHCARGGGRIVRLLYKELLTWIEHTVVAPRQALSIHPIRVPAEWRAAA